MNWAEMDAYQTLVRRLQEKYRIRDNAVATLLDEKNPKKLWNRVHEMRRRLKESLYMPSKYNKVSARIMARQEKDTYAIENVIIEDETKYMIPLNIYIPKTSTPPWPAVVVSMGHWPRGKQLPENQIFCSNLAQCGIVAATYDPICQGERVLYTKQELEQHFGSVPEDIEVVDMHMQPGNLCYLLGENLGALFVRDSTRVVDYLYTRSDVDKERIGATGQSGGGTQTTYLAALDDRICCYSPIQCLSKQAMTLAENGIGDCEQSILGISAEAGFDYSDVLWAAFPKPCMVNAASEDYFLLEGVRQLEAEMMRLYVAIGKRADFSVRVAPCGHSISAQTRMYAYEFFCRQLLGVPGPEQEMKVVILDDEELACLPHKGFGISAIQVWRPMLEYAQRQRPLKKEELRSQLQIRYGMSSVPYTVESLWQEHGWKEELLRTADGREAIYRVLCRDSHTLCVAVTSPEESGERLKELQTDILQILPWGMYSAFVKDRAGYDAETALFNTSAVLGESIVRCRIRQIQAALQRLDKQNNYERIVFWGQGPGALLALLAAALCVKSTDVVLLNSQLSFDALFDDDFYFIQETTIDPGFLKMCDLPDLAGLPERVCAVNPLTSSGKPMAVNTPVPIPAIWASDGWKAAREWLEEELC